MSNVNRKVSVKTPLGDDALLFQSFAGSEEMGRLFEFDIELLRHQSDGSIDVTALLGKDMTVTLEMPNTTTRYFNGAVTQFKHIGFVEGFYRYRATIRPWLWFLTRNANCRIFQEKSLLDIIKTVLGEHSYVDVEYKTSGSYSAVDYCVQYRESDFNFISRLMEYVGIFYYFKHEKGKHTMVVTDSGAAYQTISDYSTIPYYPPGNTNVRETDHIYEWLNDYQVQSGAYSLDDFDFEAPSSDLTAKSTVSQKYTHGDLEVYDYPGKYTVAKEGTNLTDTRMEELHTQYSLKQGQGNAMGLQAGMEFTLSQFYFAEENVKHVVVSASYLIEGDTFGSGGLGGGSIFEVSFVALNSQQQFRPKRITPKPVVSGSQTAVVVGKSGEEIWTDKYGRVKVQFHWDREGKKDENSSCWVRVSYPTAGKNWGWVSLPRIDQEVIVSFLEGDPDRPMITGRVYNAEQMPPYDLPTNQTQSGIKTRSSKKGTAENFNEIRFEDKKDSEELYVHAEKDYNRVVENNETVKIGFEKKDKGNQSLDIYNNRTTTLEEGNDSLTIKKGNRETTVSEGNNSLTISKGDHTVNIDKGKRTVNVKDNDTTTISSGDHKLAVSSGNSTIEAGSNISLDAGSAMEITSGSSMILKSNSSTEMKASSSMKIEAGTSLQIKAGTSIELKVGANSVKIDNSGITIKGMMVKVQGTTTAEMKSPLTTVKADGVLTVKGSVTMIN